MKDSCSYMNRLVKFLKRLVINTILIIFGKRGAIWLESESMIRKLKNGYYWEKEISLLQYLLSPGDVCLDVGANFGQWTYWISRQLGSSGKVIAIEPVPITALILRRVINRLRLSTLSVMIQQIAVGDRNCEVRMLIEENERTLKSLFTAKVLHHNEASDSDIRVNMLTLTSLLDLLCIDRIKFIKCDIEGAEMQFFQGGQSILTRDRPSIICEIEEKHTLQFGYTPENLFDFFYSLGYESFIYASNVLVPVMGSFPSENNYIFLHKSDESTLELLRKKGLVQI